MSVNDSDERYHGIIQCPFCNISSQRDSVSASLVHVDEIVVAFNDINPSASIHILIVPKKHLSNVSTLKKYDLETIKKMKEVGLQLISHKLNKSVEELKNQNKKERIYQIGFIPPPFNSVDHLHMHVLSKPIKTWWPRSLGFGRYIFKDADDVISRLDNLKR